MVLIMPWGGYKTCPAGTTIISWPGCSVLRLTAVLRDVV